MRLADSYKLCRRIAREKAKNFFYAFLLLPKDRHDPMCAIYAFMRESDDLIDSTSSENRSSKLAKWRQEVKNALEGRSVTDPILPAFVDTVVRFKIPHQYLFDLLDGVGMDLEKNRYATFNELYQYCYRVASVVGIVCLYLFGFNDKQAIALAESTGIAFQLTNILRDLREDALENRVYLPLDDMARFHYSVEDLKNGIVDQRFLQLIQFELDRARNYYRKGQLLISLVNPESRRTLSALIGIYHGLLKKIEREMEELMNVKVKLSLLEKLMIIFHCWRNPMTVTDP